MKRLLTFIIGLLLTLNSFAQHKLKEDDVFAKFGEVYFTFQITDVQQINALTKIISIDNVKGNTVWAYANVKEFKAFKKTGLSYTLLQHPSELVHIDVSDSPEQVLEWNYYPTYEAYESIMYQFAADHPDICKVITICSLFSGRKILAVKISDNINVDEDEPKFLYTSSMHGDETTGYPNMLHLIDYLLSNYGSNQRVTNIVNNIEIYINPLANPDGTYHGGNSSVNGAIRYNGNSVDLNRNYPDPQDGQHPDGESWQPETVGFMNFASAHHISMSANFHGGYEVVNYPWDTWPRLHADDNWWQYVSREYADTVHANSTGGYMTAENNGITNGYAWYEANGGRQDYMTYFQHGRECTIELSDTKLVPASQLLTYWTYNYRSFLNYMEQSLYGIRGVVTDSVTGQPLQTKVMIIGHDIDSSQVYANLPIGDYHRLIKAGIYSLTFSSPGYHTKTIKNISVSDKNTTWLNVQLYDGSVIPDFTSDLTSLTAGGTVHFEDQSYSSPTNWLWTFEGGTPSNSTDENPAVVYNSAGTFSVSLTASNSNSSNTITKDAYITCNSGVGIEVAEYQWLKVFPNPASGDAVVIKSQIPLKEVSIINLLGQVMKHASVSGNSYVMPVNGLTKGIYSIEAISDNLKVTHQRLIIR